MSLFEVLDPLSHSEDKSHHVGNPRTHFCNPWPSFPASHATLMSILKTRFGTKPPFIPVPDRPELVQVHTPNFSTPTQSTGFKITWIGHASFLIQVFSPTYARPVGILLDPVFSERTSPVTFFGPKRYTPTPCSISELLESVHIDVVCISHNHYDHADVTTIKTIIDVYRSRGEKVLFCVPLGNPRWLTPLGIPSEQIWEADWWERIRIPSPADNESMISPEKQSDPITPYIGRDDTSSSAGITQPSLVITCTPSQHESARGVFDKNNDLWCSWAFELDTHNLPSSVNMTQGKDTACLSRVKSLFFAGDTGYRHIPSEASGDVSSLPVCPAFAQIGNTLGPFDIALLPIGLNRPRQFMSAVHANAEDSMTIHRAIKSRKSIGMHWGTVRGGLSAYYEDVRDPPREWVEEAVKAGLRFRDRRSQRISHESNGDGKREVEIEEEWEIGLIDVGESLVV